jgi:hypothetical protein
LTVLSLPPRRDPRSHVWQGAYLTEALQEHSTKEAAIGSQDRVAAVGIKLVYLTQMADKGVSVFDLLSSIVHNASRL